MRPKFVVKCFGKNDIFASSLDEAKEKARDEARRNPGSEIGIYRYIGRVAVDGLTEEYE